MQRISGLLYKAIRDLKAVATFERNTGVRQFWPAVHDATGRPLATRPIPSDAAHQAAGC